VNRRIVIPAVAVAAFVAGELAVVLTSTSQHAELRVVGHPEARVFVLLIGWSFVGSGRSPHQHTDEESPRTGPAGEHGLFRRRRSLGSLRSPPQSE
jgi:hypothetical protein